MTPVARTRHRRLSGKSKAAPAAAQNPVRSDHRRAQAVSCRHGDGMKTRAEVDELILSWREDPAWELEETEGFEEHKAELLSVRLKYEAEWKARAGKEHAAAIAELVKPAEAFLQGIADERRSHGGDPAGFWRGLGEYKTILAAVAEMLLPIQKQIDRLDARQDDAERELDRQIDGLRKQIEAAR